MIYKPTTVGGIQAVAGLIEAVRDRLNGGSTAARSSPIVQLEKDYYQHSQYGRIWTPLLTIVAWMSLDGPAPAPTPRRRRRRLRASSRVVAASAEQPRAPAGGLTAAASPRSSDDLICSASTSSSVRFRVGQRARSKGRRNPPLCGDVSTRAIVLRLRHRRRTGATLARRRRDPRLE